MWIYEIRNLKNNKIYIGQTVQNNPNIRWRRHVQRLNPVKSPEGNVYTFTNINKFCKKHNLIESCLGRLLRGKQKYHKGWTLA